MDTDTFTKRLWYFQAGITYRLRDSDVKTSSDIFLFHVSIQQADKENMEAVDPVCEAFKPRDVGKSAHTQLSTFFSMEGGQRG